MLTSPDFKELLSLYKKFRILYLIIAQISEVKV